MKQFAVFAFFAVLATCTAMNLRSKAHNKPPRLVKTAAVIGLNSPDCPSLLPEILGVPAECLTGQNAGQCIPGIYLCDDQNDCGDASDEDLSICPPKVCDGWLSMKCPGTNMCINENWVCDGYDDCGDNSDEQNCPGRSFVSKVKATARHTSKKNLRSKAHNKPLGLIKTAVVIEQNSPDCPNGGAKCLSGEFAGRCIPSNWVCDDFNDCGDASDEDLSICPPKVCDGLLSMKCPGTNMCMMENWVCDGYNYCGDNSDEQNCAGRSFVSKVKATARHTSKMNVRSKPYNKPHALVKTAAVIEQNSTDCPNGFAKCLSGENAGQCIPNNWICDHYNDCGDASDEDLSICPKQTCESDEFDCAPTNFCIPNSWICDGYNDCGNLRDEENCSSGKVKATASHISKKLNAKK